MDWAPMNVPQPTQLQLAQQSVHEITRNFSQSAASKLDMNYCNEYSSELGNISIGPNNYQATKATLTHDLARLGQESNLSARTSSHQTEPYKERTSEQPQLVYEVNQVINI